MRKLPYCCLLLLVTYALSSCKTGAKLTSRDDGKIEVIFVQVNDVYEIAPLNGGKSGGIARLASVKKEYLKSNPNTLLTISGDFVSPSVFNSLRYEGKAIRGKQMVDALNSAGMDIAVFGNHEFDISESDLQSRIDESTFHWVSTNAFHQTSTGVIPFTRNIGQDKGEIPSYFFKTLRDADGTSVRIGFIGLVLPSNLQPFVHYTDPLQTGVEVYSRIKDSCDAVVAITHLALKDDIELAKRLPQLAVILGGHEHDMRLEKTGSVYISKAHANAKSAYIVRLQIDKKKKTVRAIPELKMLDEHVPLDSAANTVVRKWMDIGDQNYASLGFDARQVVVTKGDTLNGLESKVRNTSTNLTEMIGKAIGAAHPQAEAVIYNAGSIRVDDLLPPPVTQYDVIRTLPFGGDIVDVQMSGSLLLQVLEAGRKNRDSGGYLQTQGISFDSLNNRFSIREQVLDTNKFYRVAIIEFLLSGREQNLEFLQKDNPGITSIYPVGSEPADIRLAVMKYLRALTSE